MRCLPLMFSSFWRWYSSASRRRTACRLRNSVPWCGSCPAGCGVPACPAGLPGPHKCPGFWCLLPSINISLSIIVRFRRAQPTPWQIRLFPLDFRRNVRCPPVSKCRSTLRRSGFELWNSIFTEACLFCSLIQVSTNAVWGNSLPPKHLLRRRLLTPPLNSVASAHNLPADACVV